MSNMLKAWAPASKWIWIGLLVIVIIGVLLRDNILVSKGIRAFFFGIVLIYFIVFLNWSTSKRYGDYIEDEKMRERFPSLKNRGK